MRFDKRFCARTAVTAGLFAAAVSVFGPSPVHAQTTPATPPAAQQGAIRRLSIDDAVATALEQMWGDVGMDVTVDTSLGGTSAISIALCHTGGTIFSRGTIHPCASAGGSTAGQWHGPSAKALIITLASTREE